MEKGEIVLYQPDNSVELEVRVEDETVWLNRQLLRFGKQLDRSRRQQIPLAPWETLEGRAESF